MVPVLELWLPILMAAVAVFIVSAVFHMLLPHHKNDFGRLPNEDEMLGTLRRGGPAPGEYAMPYGTMEDMKSPEYVQKRSAGVGGLLTVLPGGPPTMSRELTTWFVFCLLISVVAAFVTGRALGPGAGFDDVCGFAAVTAFAAYGIGAWPESIWFGRPWSTTLMNTLDGLVYALVTGAIFAWLWP